MGWEMGDRKTLSFLNQSSRRERASRLGCSMRICDAVSGAFLMYTEQ